MATTMLGLLLFIFATNTQLQVSADFNINKVEGKWYQTGAATKVKWFKDSKWMTKVSVSNLMASAHGDLYINSSVILTEGNKDTACLKLYGLMTKSNQERTFFYYDRRIRTLICLTFLDVDYNNHIIIQSRWINKKGVVVINRLLTRKPVVSPQIKQKFEQISKSNKKTAGKIVILPMKGECV